jgi:hypothetical protein
MFIAPSHPGRPAPLGAGCKLNTKTHGAPPERWANLECEAINILLLGITVPFKKNVTLRNYLETVNINYILLLREILIRGM